MAKRFQQNVIGIEINEEQIFITQMDLIDDMPTVSKIKEISIPPLKIIFIKESWSKYSKSVKKIWPDKFW